MVEYLRTATLGWRGPKPSDTEEPNRLALQPHWDIFIPMKINTYLIPSLATVRHTKSLKIDQTRHASPRRINLSPPWFSPGPSLLGAADDCSLARWPALVPQRPSSSSQGTMMRSYPCITRYAGSYRTVCGGTSAELWPNP